MKCKTCGKEISEGMKVQKVIESDHYCDDICLEHDYTKEQIELMKDCSEEMDYFECYYTVFEEMEG